MKKTVKLTSVKPSEIIASVGNSPVVGKEEFGLILIRKRWYFLFFNSWITPVITFLCWLVIFLIFIHPEIIKSLGTDFSARRYIAKVFSENWFAIGISIIAGFIPKLIQQIAIKR